MLEHLDLCVDQRGQPYLSDIWEEMASYMGYASSREAVCGFESLLCGLGLFLPEEFKGEDIRELVAPVNAERLDNSLVNVSQDAVEEIFCNMLKSKQRRED